MFSFNTLQIGVYGLLGTQFAAAYHRFPASPLPWGLFAAIGIVLV
ncbi:hypothetical protein [Streptomyces sp. NBC_00887]|nr:hypothetical protein OG844_01820 [Streptomyces sp. NBC_00887]WSY36117.1 hypothetical protein OG844_43785 [Streptomyces sp. NBC_00887]